LRPAVTACGPAEIAAVLAGLDGRAVAPGPSGAPSRGRPEVLPTGRNFYSIDTRAVPTAAAWQLGWHSAGLVVERYAQEHGNYPARLTLSAWGTANMRTGGDDIAQALALMGVRPGWEGACCRVTGFEILPASVLDRPRVDVTLRISGFFRDAFPGLIDLFDSAARAVAALEEPASVNPLAARVVADRQALEADGITPDDAARRAGYRVFGSRPGAYGAGLQTLIDERIWHDNADLADAYLGWSQWAYGAGGEGMPERRLLEARLADADAVLHNQDNREHDLLDSDDYYQFEGGLAVAIRHLSGRPPPIYHNDHSQPDRPRIRSLREELGRIVRGRAANPRWIAGVMRHGYKGAAEIAATVDYLFAFAATTRAVDDAHFEALYDAYLGDPAVHDFMARHNPAALAETESRFREAVERGLWRPRRNSLRAEVMRDGLPDP
jgi:cobaltochelatase CobN